MTSELRAELIARVSAGEGVRASARALGVPEGSALWTMARHRHGRPLKERVVNVRDDMWDHRLTETWAERQHRKKLDATRA